MKNKEGWIESEHPLSAYISRLCSPSVGLRDRVIGQTEVQSAGHRSSEGVTWKSSHS